MLDTARKLCGATHILLIDDDEVISGNLLADIRGYIQSSPAHCVFQLPWSQLRDGIGHVMTSGMWGEQNVSVAFRDKPTYHWKARDGYDFHHRHPMGETLIPSYGNHSHRGTGGLMHLQFASRRRLLAKQYAYQLIERLRWPNRKMADYVRTVRESEAAAVAPVPESWWAPYQHLMKYLDIDAEPWQIEQCRRLIRENPGIEVGLEDFGLLDEYTKQLSPHPTGQPGADQVDANSGNGPGSQDE